VGEIPEQGGLSRKPGRGLSQRFFWPRYYEEKNSLRLTIGKPEQNDKIISCLKNVKEYKSYYNTKE